MNKVEVEQLTMKLAFDVVVDLAKARGVDCPLALIFQTESDHIIKILGNWNPEHGSHPSCKHDFPDEPDIRYIFCRAQDVVTARELGYPIMLVAQTQYDDYQNYFSCTGSRFDKTRCWQVRDIVNDNLKAAYMLKNTGMMPVGRLCEKAE